MELKELKEHYKKEIENIAKESYNDEQKAIANYIIDNANKDNIDSIYTFITQRVKLGFTFDVAPEVSHNSISLCKKNDKMSFENVGGIEHKLIIGENYDALKNLIITYKNQIDVIYIDPPYNTESTKKDGNDYKKEVQANNFAYRDKFTRTGWLNMMRERLILAYKLLSPKGVMFISIDNNMQAYLKVLCDEIFKEEMVSTMIWRKSGDGRDGKMKNTTTFREDHEYIICCFRKLLLNKLIEKPHFQNNYGNPDEDPRGNYKAGSISNKESASDPNHENYYSVTSPGGKVFTRQFNFSKEEFDKYNNDILVNSKGKPVSRIYWGKDGNSVPSIKIFIDEERSVTPSSLLLNKGTTTEGTKEAEEILQKNCQDIRPKPSQLLVTLIQLASSKDSIVLDFFAGSGTTGQAVMELNAKDGGCRECILVTNNENNIAKGITYERLYRVVHGKGTKGEKFNWTYTKEQPYLTNNSLSVFELEQFDLKIDDYEKAKDLINKANIVFKQLNEDYEAKDFDIYNQLASLRPYKKEEK